jgi:4-hydroxy-2-oxoheptanedioate aldolase
MRPKPLLQAMSDKSLSLGVYSLINYPEMLEIVGHSGFNHVIIDQMFTGVDWGATANMVRAAQLYGMTPIVRVQTYPWASKGNDLSVPASIARALGLGAGGAMVSVATIEELERCVAVQRDAAHRRIYITPDVEDLETSSQPLGAEGEFFVLPLIEFPELVDRMEEMVRIEGLKAVGVGIHDICASVGHPMEVEHPKVWAVIDRIVESAEKKGVAVWVNTGYRYKRVDEMVDRIGRLWDHSVRVIQVQGPETLLQHMLKQVRKGAEALTSGQR